MSSIKTIFFLLILISLIFCQIPNNPQETSDKKESKTQPEPIKEKNLNSTYDTSSKNEPREPPLNLTMDQMDTLIVCSAVVQENLKSKEKDIESVSKKLNLKNSTLVYDKVGTDIFEKCVNNIDIKLVNKFVKNLTYFNNFNWEKIFDKYTKIDFDKYSNISDLKLTIEQQILMRNFNKVNNIFKGKRYEERQRIENENKKIRIGKIDMENIPTSFKFGVFIVIIILFFGGIFYFLKNLVNKPKDKKKKKEKKKKTQ